MSALMFLIQTVASMVLGFLVGFLLGRAVRDVHRIADAVTDEETAVPQDRPNRPRWLSTQLVVAAIVVLLGVLTVAQGLIQSAATERLTECQADYSNQFADALEARSAATAQAQSSLDELIAVVAQSIDPTVIQRAVNDYLAKRDAVQREQQANPYPEPPRDACR